MRKLGEKNILPRIKKTKRSVFHSTTCILCENLHVQIAVWKIFSHVNNSHEKLSYATRFHSFTTLFVFLAQWRPDVCHRPRSRQEQPPPDPRGRGKLRQDQPYGQAEGTSGDVQPQRDSFIKGIWFSAHPSITSPYTTTLQQRASTRPPDFVCRPDIPHNTFPGSEEPSAAPGRDPR